MYSYALHAFLMHMYTCGVEKKLWHIPWNIMTAANSSLDTVHCNPICEQFIFLGSIFLMPCSGS